MKFLIVTYLCSLAAGIGLFALMQYLRGRRELLSVRNLALIGLVIFQITSVALRVYLGSFEPFLMSDPIATALRFCLWASLFAGLALLAYERGWIVRRLAHKVPISTAVPSAPTMLLMALILVVLGAFLRLASKPIGTLAVVADFWGTGFASMAAGLVGWVWARRLLNPMIIVYALFIGGAGLGIVMMGAFGRRGIVAIAGALIFGMYYSQWRSWRPRAVFARLALLAAPPVVFMALYTSVRTSAEHDRTTGQHLQAMSTQGNLKQGVMLLLDGQNTGTETLWLMENYPERFQYRPLFTLYYTGAVMVPRVIWPTKPDALSNLVATQAKIDKVNRDRIKLSPGILGSAAAEGGLVAVLIYGVAFGLFLRFFDELISRAPWSPMVVLPVSSNLGQVLGLARGETAVFANTYMLTVLGCWLAMLVVGRAAQRMRGDPIAAPLTTDPNAADPDAAWPDDESRYDEYAGYGVESEEEEHAAA